MGRHLKLAIVVGLALAVFAVLIEPSLISFDGRPVLRQQAAKLLCVVLAALTVAFNVLLFTHSPALPTVDTMSANDLSGQALICTMRC